MNAAPTLSAILPGLMVAGGLLGAAGFCVAYKTLDVLSTPPTPEKDRLKRILNPQAGQEGPKFTSLLPLLRKQLSPYGDKIYSINEEQKATLRLQLTYAGRASDNNALRELLTERLVYALIIGAFIFGGTLSLPIPFLFNLCFVMTGLYVGGLVPLFLLKRQATERRQNMQATLPELLDLMVVCVQAGLALDATMRRVARECQQIAPELSKEFQQLGRDLNAGLPRMEAFHNLAERNGLEELKSLCSLIIQSDRMGVSISQALKVFSEDLRTRRRQRAEELAAKASVKMTLPLVFFVFPPMMIILLGPMLMQMVKVFGGGH